MTEHGCSLVAARTNHTIQQTLTLEVYREKEGVWKEKAQFLVASSKEPQKREGERVKFAFKGVLVYVMSYTLTESTEC